MDQLCENITCSYDWYEKTDIIAIFAYRGNYLSIV